MTKYEQAEQLYSCVGIQEAGNYDTLLNVCTLLFKAYKELEAENKELMERVQDTLEEEYVEKGIRLESGIKRAMERIGKYKYRICTGEQVIQIIKEETGIDSKEHTGAKK